MGGYRNPDLRITLGDFSSTTVTLEACTRKGRMALGRLFGHSGVLSATISKSAWQEVGDSLDDLAADGALDVERI